MQRYGQWQFELESVTFEDGNNTIMTTFACPFNHPLRQLGETAVGNRHAAQWIRFVRVEPS